MKVKREHSGMYEELKRLKIDRYVWASQIRSALDRIVDVGSVSILCLTDNRRTLSVRVMDTKDALIAKFQLSFMPGCKGVIISHASEVTERYRRRGIATRLDAIKEQFARELGAGFMLATVRSDNKAQTDLFNGGMKWCVLDYFGNPRTDANIILFKKRLLR